MDAQVQTLPQDPLRGDPSSPEVVALVTLIRRGDTRPRDGEA